MVQNQIQQKIFESTDFGEIRVFEQNGEAWFVGRDVCKAFGDKNSSRTLSRVDDEDKQIITITDSMGRTQNVIIINESGLYSVLFAMQPQKAHHDGVSDEYPIEIQERIDKLRQFKHWVTAEVLPSIRKTGRYAAPNVPNMDKLSLTTQCLINLEIANNQLRKDLDGAVQKLDIAVKRIEELERSKPMQKGKLVPTTVAPKAWSEREKDYLRKAYALGQTDVEIAAELGRTESSIRSKRKKLGLCGRGGTKWTADEDKKLMKLYEKGLTYNEIGQLIGRSYEGVSNRISKLRKKRMTDNPTNI